MGRLSSTNNNNLTYYALLAAWGGSIAAATTTFVIRKYRRRQLELREEKIVRDGGLLPSANNAVHALEIRAATMAAAETAAGSSSNNNTTSSSLALEGADGTTYSWSEYYDEVQWFARALTSIAPGGFAAANVDGNYGVAIHAFNCPKWFFSAIGALAAGWTVSGIYLSNTYDQACHIIRTSEARVLVVESYQVLNETYPTVLHDFPQLTVVVLSQQKNDNKPHPRVFSYDDFIKKGIPSIQLPSPSDLPNDAVAALVYTSGTTGNPKATELTHGSIRAVCSMMHARIPLSTSDNLISYLPLSHIAGMGIDLFGPMFCGAQVHFADADALRGTLKDTLLKVRPTLFFGVPRVWEKMSAAMQAAAATSYSKRVSGPVLKAIGTTAKKVAGTWWSVNTPEVVRCLLVVPYGFFKLLAFRKIRRGTGLDRCKLLYTGAAPLSDEILNYLRSVDMPILEVFGMSESSGAIAVCGPQDAIRPLGACGRALPIGKLEIAPDGEILWTGKNNLKGYKGLPAATEAVLPSKTGQLHTGDLGRIDSSGYLYITGRKKDIIITAGGENVAPIPIESALKTLLGESAGHVLLIGDTRKFLTALIAPAESAPLPSEQSVEAALHTYNTTLAKSRAQRVQRAHVLDSPLTVETGELTPTLKVKRTVVLSKCTAEINAMYQDGSSRLVGYSSMDIGSLKNITAA